METIIDNVTALYSLGYSGFWGSSKNLIFPEGVTPPTEAEIDSEVIRLQAEFSAQEYARNRATEYPNYAEQLDEIYHNGMDSWKAVIKVTKDKYPK